MRNMKPQWKNTQLHPHTFYRRYIRSPLLTLWPSLQQQEQLRGQGEPAHPADNRPGLTRGEPGAVKALRRQYGLKKKGHKGLAGNAR